MTIGEIMKEGEEGTKREGDMEEEDMALEAGMRGIVWVWLFLGNCFPSSRPDYSRDYHHGDRYRDYDGGYGRRRHDGRYQLREIWQKCDQTSCV